MLPIAHNCARLSPNRPGCFGRSRSAHPRPWCRWRAALGLPFARYLWCLLRGLRFAKAHIYEALVVRGPDNLTKRASVTRQVDGAVRQ